jgi:hypothetical protein
MYVPPQTADCEAMIVHCQDVTFPIAFWLVATLACSRMMFLFDVVLLLLARCEFTLMLQLEYKDDTSIMQQASEHSTHPAANPLSKSNEQPTSSAQSSQFYRQRSRQ